MERFSKAMRMVLGGALLAVGMSGATAALAQDGAQVSGKIEWGVWVDADGCMHWWADGGIEGYMVPRRNPKTGKPVCLKRETCLVENADALFAAGSARLTEAGRQRLVSLFRASGSQAYAVYNRIDRSAADSKLLRLSEQRASVVAELARSSGRYVDRDSGMVAAQPAASTGAEMPQNGRLEIVCFRR